MSQFTPQASKRAIDYLNGFKINDLNKLVNDYNYKIQNYLGDDFLNEVYNLILSAYPNEIKPAQEPNWRGFRGLVLLSQEQFIPDYLVAMKYQMLHNRAKEKGLDFDLTLSDIKRLYRTKLCYYTKQRLNDTETCDSNYRTFERIDNTKGYTKDNVVVCTLQMNQLKSNLFESKSSPAHVNPKLLHKFLTTFLKTYEAQT